MPKTPAVSSFICLGTFQKLFPYKDVFSLLDYISPHILGTNLVTREHSMGENATEEIPPQWVYWELCRRHCVGELVTLNSPSLLSWGLYSRNPHTEQAAAGELLVQPGPASGGCYNWGNIPDCQETLHYLNSFLMGTWNMFRNSKFGSKGTTR